MPSAKSLEDWKQDIVPLQTAIHHDLEIISKDENYVDARPLANAPASEADIKVYQDHLGVILPPSYRAFLRLYNGYRSLAYPGEMLSISDVNPGGKSYPKIMEWKKRMAGFGAAEVVDGIVIASLGQPNDWVYLDPNRIAENGEFTVVKFSPEQSIEYADVTQFLSNSVVALLKYIRERYELN